jgi:glycosyltransferase involved in cell wall biosynthesis
MNVSMSPNTEAAIAQQPSSLAEWAALLQTSACEARMQTLVATNDLQEEWRLTLATDKTGKQRYSVPFFHAADAVITPFVGDRIISAGLDWDNKDIPAISAMKRLRGFQWIQIIYDLIPVLEPQFVVPAIRERIRAHFEAVSYLGDVFACISRRTESDWTQWRSGMGEVNRATKVIPLASEIDLPLHSVSASDIVPLLQQRKYAIYVSTIEPRKNHRTLYLAWKRAIAERRIDPEKHALLFIGMPGWCSEDLIDAIQADRTLRGSIIFCSHLSDAELATLVKACTLTLFPSFYEGFGLGLTEALLMGKFGIASTSGALPEVGGNFVDYLDPDDILGWSTAIGRYMNDTNLLANKETNLRNFQRISWGKAAACLINEEFQA